VCYKYLMPVILYGLVVLVAGFILQPWIAFLFKLISALGSGIVLPLLIVGLFAAAFAALERNSTKE